MNKRAVALSIIAAETLLLVSLVAMQFTSEVDWDGRDFAIAAILLAGLGAAFHMIVAGFKNRSKTTVTGLLLAGLLLLAWAELAVGVFGTPLAGS